MYLDPEEREKPACAGEGGHTPACRTLTEWILLLEDGDLAMAALDTDTEHTVVSLALGTTVMGRWRILSQRRANPPGVLVSTMRETVCGRFGEQECLVGY